MSRTPPILAEDLFPSAVPDHYDELRNPLREPREHWRTFFEQLGEDASAEGLERRERTLKRLVHEHGITYNVYGDETGPERRWSLDLLPFIVPTADWKIIASAVEQRAALLSAIVADVYGPQVLFARGLLPPALVLASPRYLRPLHGVVPAGGAHLHLVAFDLARSPQGTWWVASQRTQAPSGLGYALENRIIVSQVFPESFAALRVQRLAATFRRLLDTVTRLAPPREAGDGPGPGIVLLTPGPFNETYFEHAYLARYLGTPLVTGQDLTVREDRVYLKTLHGLERVRAVIRRLDDAFCDPLELRPDSALGVPGLVQAIRAGKVLLANALGSGFLESHAIHGFLPAICRHFLGQPLLIPSRDTWWCGEDLARRDAFATLEMARVRPALPGASDAEFEEGREFVPLADWRERIEATPDRYTIQTHVPFSKTPGWHGGRLVPRSALLRVYAVLDAQGQWHAMPGGLTRIAQSNSQVSMQRGGSSADTWVITGEAVDSYSMLPARARADRAPSSRRTVTSRAAESLFWMGRYSERAENSVRFARNFLSLLRERERGRGGLFERIATLAIRQGLAGASEEPLQAPALERAILDDLADPEARSLAYVVAALGRCASGVRERLSLEHWRTIDSLAGLLAGAREEELAQGREGAAREEVAVGSMQAIALHLGALTGAQTDAMTRDDGWRLLTLGRQIERIATMSSVIELLFPAADSGTGGGFDLVLALFDSTITYRSRTQGVRDPAALVELLVLETANPRALACCAGVIEREIAALQQATRTGDDAVAPWSAGPLLQAFADSVARGEPGLPTRLQGLARELRSGASGLSDWLGSRYFTHSAPARSLAL